MAVFRKAKKAGQAEIDDLRAQVSRLTTQIGELTASHTTNVTHLDDLSTRLGSLDARIAQIGTEVTHQLGELSGDIDSLGRRTNSLDDEINKLGHLPDVVEEVRTDQARLANEQARYEIAFRQDLAEIVDQFQRRRPTN